MYITTKIRRRRPALLSFSVCIAGVFLLFASLHAFAVNLDYLQEQKWQGNQHINWEPINASSGDKLLTGTFGWYVDSSRCLYTYFAVDGELAENSGNTVKIAYHAVAGEEEYDFAADANGICDTLSDEASRLFDVSSNFEGSNHGVYITAVQYVGNADACLMNISFYNGRTVRIAESLSVDLPEEEPVAEEDTTWYSVVEEKTTKAATTKATTAKSSGSAAKSSGSTAGKAGSGAGTTATTKFVPQGNYFDTSVNNDATETATEAAAVSAQAPAMSRDAVLLMTVGILLLLGGAGLLLFYRRRNRPEPKTATEAPPVEESSPQS